MSKQSLMMKDNVVKHSASEIWCLMHFLLLMIGETVAEDDLHWSLILSPLECMSFIFASAIQKNTIYYIQSIIEDHSEVFCQIFPEEQVNSSNTISFTTLVVSEKLVHY